VLLSAETLPEIENEIASANEFFSHLEFFLLPHNDAAVLSLH
jgi:hypothetical protein